MSEFFTEYAICCWQNEDEVHYHVDTDQLSDKLRTYAPNSNILFRWHVASMCAKY